MGAKYYLSFLYEKCIKILRGNSIQSYRHDVEAIFCDVFGCSWSELQIALMNNRGARITDEKSEQILACIDRRVQHQPLQYILQKAEFMGHTFRVDGGVFIPRPETETLVRLACSYIAERIKGVHNAAYASTDMHRDTNAPVVVYDLCAGSGAIGISVQKEFGNKVQVTLVEKSGIALEFANLNCLNLFSDSEIRPKCSKDDALTFNNFPERPDLILSNPPYVPPRNLPPELSFEPKSALYGGGKRGLHFIANLVPHAFSLLQLGGAFIIEHDEKQGDGVQEIFESAGFTGVVGYKDLNDRSRFVFGVKWHTDLPNSSIPPAPTFSH
ncbi:MAG: peptide chain release factor N(5)-glutamine methyltransferase [Bifidobacteriaceae bacterium]|jgi:release factor glutamine methyltransferase|nr:peptide chain release factor N(5)-glutamine methyltransferase [Bifidobacteriaceae bacterium]